MPIAEQFLAVTSVACEHMPTTPVTQLIIDRLRSPRLFATLVDYASPLVYGSGEGLKLARHITAASRRGDPADCRRLLQVLMPLLDELTDENDRATLLHSCADLASGEDVGQIFARVGMERADAPPQAERRETHTEAEGWLTLSYDG